MIFVALVSLPIFYIDNRVSRVEGVLLLGYYVCYLVFILMQATGNSALPAMSWFIAIFVPLSFLALLAFAIRSARWRRRV